MVFITRQVCLLWGDHCLQNLGCVDVKFRAKEYKLDCGSTDLHPTTWTSPDLYPTFAWSSPDHLTFTWPSLDPYLTFMTNLIFEKLCLNLRFEIEPGLRKCIVPPLFLHLPTPGLNKVSIISYYCFRWNVNVIFVNQTRHVYVSPVTKGN